LRKSFLQSNLIMAGLSPTQVPTDFDISNSFEGDSIATPSITGCVLLILLSYTFYAWKHESVRFKVPALRSFKLILIYVFFSVTFHFIMLHMLISVDEEEVGEIYGTPLLCSDNMLFSDSRGRTCTHYKKTPRQCGILGEDVWVECPCSCNKSSINGNKDFRDFKNRSCLYYDWDPSSCGYIRVSSSLVFSECSACYMSDQNNKTWRDSKGFSCMRYRSKIKCGVNDSPGEQSAWDACPTFCNKSEILGDMEWRDRLGQSCLFYQKERWVGNALVSGSAFCGYFDGNTPAYNACDVCDIGRTCQPDIGWKNDINLGCSSYAPGTVIRSRGRSITSTFYISCGAYDKEVEQKSWDACPCYCNYTQELNSGKRTPGWNDELGNGCNFYQRNVH
jgi:hypothetical protein